MSSNHPVIEAHEIELAYRIDRNRTGTLKEYAVNLFKGKVERETLLALKGVSFEIERGQIFGVIGRNGAGKSTLMKVIARILPPTSGRVIVRGSVAPMIALGAGFNPEQTARENIVLFGSLVGRDIGLMRRRVEPIVEWAGLEDYVDVPIRALSSGMLARLAFSVATDMPADVLVVDEVLAVGDEAFRRRSQARMEELMHGGSTVILVSHALPMIRQLADRVMWLDLGRIIEIGEADEVVDSYEATVE